MRKVLVFGNSGSGKSTLAKELCERGGSSRFRYLGMAPYNASFKKTINGLTERDF